MALQEMMRGIVAVTLSGSAKVSDVPIRLGLPRWHRAMIATPHNRIDTATPPIHCTTTAGHQNGILPTEIPGLRWRSVTMETLHNAVSTATFLNHSTTIADLQNITPTTGTPAIKRPLKSRVTTISWIPANLQSSHRMTIKTSRL
jgi:hypothetical protein